MKFFRRSPPSTNDDENSHSSYDSEETNEYDDELNDDDAAIAKPTNTLDSYLQPRNQRQLNNQDSIGTGNGVAAGDAEEASPADANAKAVKAASEFVMGQFTGEQRGQHENHSDHDGEESDHEGSEEESDDESSVESPKKKGWFGFLRRNKSVDSDDEYTSEEEEEHSVDEPPQPQQLEPEVVEQDHQQLELEQPHPAQQSPHKRPSVTEADEEEIAAAIARVQRRIADYRKKQGENGMNGSAGPNNEEVGVVEREEHAEAQEPNYIADKLVTDDEEKTVSAQDVSLETEPSEKQNAEDILTESSAETLLTQESENNPITDINGEADRNQDIPKETQQHNNEENEEDQPTLSERRSLLSLAAEHNRVDVIKELIGMTSEEAQASLLQGLGGHTTEQKEDGDTFVPPPLHAAVAHGSIDAASCLLRMGADPSLRPLLPDNVASGRMKRSNSATEQDRNYKKYHGRSAWELAFGALVRVDRQEKEEEAKSSNGRGWFGFGAKEDEQEMIHKNEEGVQYKKISGLNIPQAKLDGIHHAFTAEALRAIGSDEVHRVSQLIKAGMTPEIEVAGKSLSKWAREMDALKCLDLLMQSHLEEEDSSDAEEERDEEEIVEKSADIDEEHDESESTEFHLDERLVGLSQTDIVTLIQENESLVPALTSCRDDLAEETDMCQNILRDIQAAGGKGGLSSRTLLDMVRSLKDDRQELEESLMHWQEVWEEREDELDFFWEEAMDEVLREEFVRSGVLDRVTEPILNGARPISEDLTLQQLGHRYKEADRRVSVLRSSIASLAEESARYRDEIESSGMSGALLLVRSLRSEVKEIKEKISQAQAGESNCRKKIVLIRKRIGHQATEEEELEDFQLKAIVGGQEGVDRGRSPILVEVPSENVEIKNNLSSVPNPEVFANQPRKVQDEDGSCSVNEEGDREEYDDEVESYEDDQDDRKQVNADDSHSATDESYREEDSDDNESTDAEDYEVVESAVDRIMHDEESVNETQLSAENVDEDELPVIFTQPAFDLEQLLEQSHQDGSIETTKVSNEVQDGAMTPSEAVTSGKSTAIVVRQPNAQSSSLSSQIWDLLRQIVGMRRSSSSGYHEYDANNSRHIMIV